MLTSRYGQWHDPAIVAVVGGEVKTVRPRHCAEVPPHIQKLRGVGIYPATGRLAHDWLRAWISSFPTAGDRGTTSGVSGAIWRAAGGAPLLSGTAELARRPPREDLSPDPQLPADTRLWALLQHASGGVWGGCVYDVDAIAFRLGGRV